MTPQEFVAKWKNVTLKERSAAQEHFIDLCRLVGHDPPAEADPTGQTFTFEAGAAKQGGGQSWADIWKPSPRPPASRSSEKRDNWLNPPGLSEKDLKKRTLTNLYNQRPTWLDLAHQKLDLAVLDAYGWPHTIADEEILGLLLALNLERVTALP